MTLLAVSSAAFLVNLFFALFVLQKLSRIQESINQIIDHLSEKNENKHIEDLNNRLSFIQQAKFSPLKFNTREQ